MRLRLYFLLLLTLSATPALAAVKWIEIGVNGLTCSLCTRSVEMSLRKLDFVDNVVMSLETTDGRIYLKDDVPVNLNDIPKAIVKAGFSVRFVKLHISFDDTSLKNDGSFEWQGQTFRWANFQKKPPGPVALKLVGENFLPKKENAEWKQKLATVKGDERVIHVVEEG